MEIDPAQPGQRVDQNEALTRLQQLEEEAKRLREQLQASASAEAPTAPKEPAEPISSPDEEALPPQPDDRQKEEADKLLQRYRLEKQRGNKDFASRYLAEAVQLAPGYTYVIECQGDEAVDNRRTEEAKRLYKQAKTIDPRNHSADGKLANLVFKFEAAPASAHLKMQESMASAKWATVLSAILPGLGQITVGQVIKGVVIMCIWIPLLILGSPISTFTTLAAGKTPPGLYVLGMVGAVFVHIVNIVDMSAFGKASMARQAFMGMDTKKPERPVPPVDKPFE